MSPYLSTVYFSGTDVEQIVKDLQVQNAQFQQILMDLTKGQEELKTLLAKEKKKTKKPTGVVIMGRRFKGHTRRTLDFATSSGEGDNRGAETQEVNDDPASEGEEEPDYSEEQYPPADINTNS